MSAMVERVAKAIAHWRDQGADDMVIAAGAIIAMREPTKAMMDAGISHMYEAPYASDAEAAYVAMIDEALK